MMRCWWRILLLAAVAQGIRIDDEDDADSSELHLAKLQHVDRELLDAASRKLTDGNKSQEQIDADAATVVEKEEKLEAKIAEEDAAIKESLAAQAKAMAAARGNAKKITAAATRKIGEAARAEALATGASEKEANKACKGAREKVGNMTDMASLEADELAQVRRAAKLASKKAHNQALGGGETEQDAKKKGVQAAKEESKKVTSQNIANKTKRVCKALADAVKKRARVYGVDESESEEIAQNASDTARAVITKAPGPAPCYSMMVVRAKMEVGNVEYKTLLADDKLSTAFKAAVAWAVAATAGLSEEDVDVDYSAGVGSVVVRSTVWPTPFVDESTVLARLDPNSTNCTFAVSEKVSGLQGVKLLPDRPIMTKNLYVSRDSDFVEPVHEDMRVDGCGQKEAKDSVKTAYGAAEKAALWAGKSEEVAKNAAAVAVRAIGQAVRAASAKDSSGDDVDVAEVSAMGAMQLAMSNEDASKDDSTAAGASAHNASVTKQEVFVESGHIIGKAVKDFGMAVGTTDEEATGIQQRLIKAVQQTGVMATKEKAAKNRARAAQATVRHVELTKGRPMEEAANKSKDAYKHLFKEFEIKAAQQEQDEALERVAEVAEARALNLGRPLGGGNNSSNASNSSSFRSLAAIAANAAKRTLKKVIHANLKKYLPIPPCMTAGGDPADPMNITGNATEWPTPAPTPPPTMEPTPMVVEVNSSAEIPKAIADSIARSELAARKGPHRRRSHERDTIIIQRHGANSSSNGSELSKAIGSGSMDIEIENRTR